MSFALPGYYALISSPLDVRYWNGQGWVGDVFRSPKIEIVGFADSLEIVPILVVEDEDEDTAQTKFCSACGTPNPINEKSCNVCRGPSFSLTQINQINSSIGQPHTLPPTNFVPAAQNVFPHSNSTSAVKRFCWNCGTPIQAIGQQFCGSCGAKI